MINIEFLKDFFITKDLTLFVVYLFVLIIYWFKNRFFRIFVLWFIKRTPTTLDDDLYPLFNQLINILLVVSAIITTLIKLGIQPQSIITACSAISLAIVLAIKDSVINIIAGFVIMIDKPFKIGDKCCLYSGEEVTVLDIGLRRTKFQCDKNNKPAILIIRNTELMNNKIYNYTMEKKNV